MAVKESNALLQYKDANGDTNLLYPITNLDCVVGAEDLAEAEALKSHINDKDNPHAVTKTQVGLGNVPNVATNDQTPTYTAASTLSALVSGEKLSVSFGKISKATSDLILHLTNKNNPHGVTKGQVGLGNVDNTADADKPVSTAVQAALDKKSNEGHTHDYAPSEHTHKYAGSASVGGPANSVKTNLVIKLNGGATEGTNLFTFNGSTAKTINITPSSIGAAATNHGNHVPATETANDAKFLRNDNTWQTVTPANIGAATSEHNHDDKYDAKGAAAAIKNELLNGAGEAYDTLKELGVLITENQDAIDALETVATGKANASDLTSHTSNKSNPHGVTIEQIGAAASDHTHSAYVNQNAFSNVKVGSTTIAADTVTDTLTLVAGSNVTITPDATNDKVTISATDTVYTHPTYTAVTGKPTANQAPAFGGTATVSQITSDGTGHVTGATDRTITIPSTLSNGTGTAGLIKTSSTVVDSNGYTACPVISGVPYYKDTNTTYTHPASHPASMITGLSTVATSGSYNDLSNKPTIPAAYIHPTTSGNKHIPSGGSSGQILRWSADGTAVWGADNNTTYSVMSGASSSTAGTSGLVPAPVAGKQTSFLRGDGTWVVPTNTTYNAATTSAAGLMSAADKTKLDGIAAGANAYTHPSYTAKSSGLYKVTVDASGHVSATAAVAKSDITGLGIPAQDTTYSAATTSAAGLMSAADKAKANYTNMAYCTCTTAAATAAKVITVSGNTNWALTAGSFITVYFSYTNTASNPTFNVNGTGAKNVYYGSAQITTSALSYAGTANRPLNFMYDGTQYRFIGWGYDANTTYTNVKLGHGYATCTTAAATTAKVGTLSSYTLTIGGIVAVKFTYAVPAGATLNINSKGAKAIYHKGAAITAGVINAGDTATFIYNGSYYHLISLDRIPVRGTDYWTDADIATIKSYVDEAILGGAW